MNNFGANPSDLSIYSNKNRGKPKVSILHYSLFNIHSSLLGLAQSDKPKFETVIIPHFPERRPAMKHPAKKIALLGLCTAIAMVLAWVEIQLPPLVASIPGIKLGLPNIAIIFILYRFSWKEAAAVSFVRIVAVSLIFNPATLPYSLAGGCLSLLGMTLLKKTDLLSTTGVSVAGGVLHNVGQILMAMLILSTAGLGYYMIVLAVTGVVSGIFVGLCGSFAVKRVRFR